MTTDTRQEATTPFGWLLRWQAILAVAVSAIGYGLAYVHELGFNAVFGIPQDLVSLNLTTVLITISRVLGVLILLICIVSLLAIVRYYFVKDEKWRRRLQRATPQIVFLFYLISIWVAYRSLWRDIVFMLFGYLFMLLFSEAIWRSVPLFTQRKVSGYRQKVKAQDEFERKVYDPVRDFLSRYVVVFLIVLGLIYLFLTASLSGEGTARSQQEFLVTSTNPEMVALRTYGDNLVCAPFDRGNGTITEPLVIIRADSQSGLLLKLEHVGPLKVKHH